MTDVVRTGSRAEQGVASGDAAKAGHAVLAAVAIVGATHGALSVADLSVRYSGDLNPLAQAMSYYVYVDGARLHFTLALLEIAVSSLALTVGLRRSGAFTRPVALALLTAWSLGMAVVALSPTDNDPRILSLPGVIHQIAGASLFVTLPFAVLLSLRDLAARSPWRSIVPAARGLSIATLVFALSYLIARLPDIAPGWAASEWISGAALGGIFQRALFVSEMVLVLVFAVRLLQLSRTPLRCATGTCIAAMAGITTRRALTVARLGPLLRQGGWYIAAGAVTTGASAALFLLLRTPLGAFTANLAAVVITTVANTEFHRRVTFHHPDGPVTRRAAAIVLTVFFYAGYTSTALLILDALVAEPTAAQQTASIVAATVFGGVARFALLRGWVFTSPLERAQGA